MDANDFFEHAQDMVRDVFNQQGEWQDAAVAWTGNGRQIAMIELHRSEEGAPARLHRIILEQGFPAFAVAYEAYLNGSEDLDEVKRDGRRALDETLAFATAAERRTLPEHVVFIFMEAEDGTSRSRAFEVVGEGTKRLGRRVEALENSTSPFSGVYVGKGPRH